VTVALTSNFFANARGITFEDTASVTWALDPATNELTATASGGGGGGGLTSVGLVDESTTPIYTITNSPLVANGDLEITLNTQSANLVFAGPTVGLAAQPSFRALVFADISGLVGVGANPTAKVGLTAVNGTSGDFIRSDGSPPIDQSIAPTWTGIHTFSGTGNGNAIVLSGAAPWINASGANGLTISATYAMTLAMGGNFTIDQAGDSIWQMVSGAVTQQSSAGQISYTLYGAANEWTHYVIGSSTSNQSFGQQIQAGTSSSDKALNIIDYANSHTLFSVYGDGGIVAGAATGGDEGRGTVNVAGGYYINGVAVSAASLLPLTTKGDLLYENATPVPARLAIGSNGAFLTAASGIPAWSTNTVPSTDSQGDLWYASAANVISALAIGGANTALVSNGTIPGWTAIVNSVVAGTNISVSAATGAVTIGCTLASANPSATIGLAAVNGTAGTWMTSDSAPPLSQAIVPTWTGLHTWTAAVNASAIVINGSLNTGNHYLAQLLTDSSATGFASGLLIEAGTNASDNALYVANAAGSIGFFKILGSGAIDLGYNGTSYAVTISATGNIALGYVSTGVAITAGASTGVGMALTIVGSNAGANTDAGGLISITGGTGQTSGKGGAVTLQGGAAGSTGDGGLATLAGGTTTAGTGGGVAVTAQPGVANATAGGAVTITAGAGVTSGAGGSITLQSGASPTGTAGSIILSTGTTAAHTAVTIAPAGTVTIAQPVSGTTAALNLPASTATIPMLAMASGVLLTSATAGNFEYDGTNSYFTNETTSGRGLIPVEQIFHLAADGSGITTIANFFGATSNISLVSGGYYEIEIVLYYTMGATGSVVTWTLTNSAAPTSMDLYYEMCPVTGIVAPPGTATMLVGQILGGTTAAQTVVTTSLTGGTSQYARFRIMLKNGTGTSLKIQATETTQTTSLTPKLGSYWKCKRIPAGNVGTFAT
jgi:hypothetical protein